MTDYAYIPVRLSHILGYCAVGSVIRGPRFLVTPMDTSFWTDVSKQCAARPIPYVNQVRSALGIGRELREPPTAQLMENGLIDGTCIPAMRFPSWMRCPACKRLYCAPWRHQEDQSPACTICDHQPALEQVPWVFVDPMGHMADVPWHRLAHANAKTPAQKQCGHEWDRPYLRLKEDPQGADYILSCDDCRASTRFRPGPQPFYGKLRCQPWLNQAPATTGLEPASEAAPGLKPELRSELESGLKSDPNPTPKPDQENSEADATALPEILSINDTRVHRPVGTAALVIPPESRIRKGSVVDRIYVSSRRRQQLDRPMPDLARESLFRQWADEFRCSPDQVKKAVDTIHKGYPTFGMNFTQGKLLESEYKALTQPIPDLFDDEDFVTTHYTQAWHDLKKTLPPGGRPTRIIDAVSTLVSVNRLKEILIFKGFQRLNADIVSPDISGEADWLPALELYGEGIFFTLDDTLLKQWESLPSVMERTDPVEKRYKAAGFTFEPAITPCPRFILLHTLTHLVIRELETLAGYPAASLKERIYSGTGKNPMAGILIYVAVPDVEGSLGGLFELARPGRFLRLLSSVFDQAEWCSLDPVCSEHEGQGPAFLNRAACHACALIPEPACACANTLLDRGLVKGWVDEDGTPVPGILDAATETRSK